MKFKQVIPWVLILGIFLSACASTQESTPAAMGDKEDAVMEDEMEDMETDKEMDDSQTDDMASDDAMVDEPSDEMMVPAWFSAELIDVHTGEAFRINDLQGQVILVETMAVWCSNCLRQQREVQALHEVLGDREDFTSIALDIDINEDADKLRNFATSNGFDWRYAVAPIEVARQFGELYGQQFLNPPSTPILLVDLHGEVHLLPFGIKSTADLKSSVENLLNGEM